MTVTWWLFRLVCIVCIVYAKTEIYIVIRLDATTRLSILPSIFRRSYLPNGCSQSSATALDHIYSKVRECVCTCKNKYTKVLRSMWMCSNELIAYMCAVWLWWRFVISHSDFPHRCWSIDRDLFCVFFINRQRARLIVNKSKPYILRTVHSIIMRINQSHRLCLRQYLTFASS